MTEVMTLEKYEKTNKPVGTNLTAFLELAAPRIAAAIPKHLTPEVMIQAVLNHPQKAKIAACTGASILSALVTCSQLGLPPNTPQKLAYLIPYGNQCQVVFGYHGLAQLVRNSGQVARMNAGVVYADEWNQGSFSYSEEPPDLVHKGNPAARRTDDQLMLAYAVIVTKDGERLQTVMTRDQVYKRRDASQGYQNAKKYNKQTPWDDWEPEMWMKTALRKLCGGAEAPKATEDLAIALARDYDQPSFDAPAEQSRAARMAAAIDVDASVVEPGADAEQAAPEAAAAAPVTAAEPPPPKAPPESKLKRATKAQVAKAWKRWCVIMNLDPAGADDEDKHNFKGFVFHILGPDKAQDSKLWTPEDCGLVDAALDDLRDGSPTQQPVDPEPEPEETEADRRAALDQLKDTRDELGFAWPDLRTIAKELGIQAQSSGKWSAADCRRITARMEDLGPQLSEKDPGNTDAVTPPPLAESFEE